MGNGILMEPLYIVMSTRFRQSATRTSDISGLILAAGEGIRLRPMTSYIPKPMIPIYGPPMLERIMNHMRHHGITQIVLVVGHQSDYIKDYFLDGSKFGVRISYLCPQNWREIGPIGSIRLSREVLEDDFLLYAGDTLTNIDLGEVIALHRRKPTVATVPLVTTTSVQMGAMHANLATDGTVMSFEPLIANANRDSRMSLQLTAEIFLLNKRVFNFMGGEVKRLEEALGESIRAGHRVNGLPVKGYWYHVNEWSDLGNVYGDIAEEKLRLEY